MKIGIIGEGETEYACLPTIASKLGHVTVGCHNLGGIGDTYPIDDLFNRKIFPYVRGFALKQPISRPDKVIIVFDRERRPECCGSIAQQGMALLTQKLEEDHLSIPISVVIPNRLFECWLLANTTALDGSPLFKNPLSPLLGDDVDDKNVNSIIKQNLRPGICWDKPRYGKALAQKLDPLNALVLQKSRSLRKFVKELS